MRPAETDYQDVALARTIPCLDEARRAETETDFRDVALAYGILILGLEEVRRAETEIEPASVHGLPSFLAAGRHGEVEDMADPP